ncbi:thioredoxin family protein [Elizabethkingia anophelis]|nr:thioredoxin family protein [Elizabethkingia anophelis]MCT4122341.1 thioredoxin family protein [Elizabethkingia anophelis]
MDLANKIESEQLTMVNFHATWCPPCVAMKPNLDEVVAEYGESINYERIDIDKDPELAQQFGIRSVPTTMLFKSGKLKWKHSGIVPSNELGKLVQENI